jgi:hypothetical protein
MTNQNSELGRSFAALVSALALIVGCAQANAESMKSDYPNVTFERATTPRTNPAPQDGMTGFVDPATGRIVPPPAADSTGPRPMSVQEQNAFSTSPQGLVVEPSPGGGERVNLQGRFQQPLVGTITADGKAKFDHGEAPGVHK